MDDDLRVRALAIAWSIVPLKEALIQFDRWYLPEAMRRAGSISGAARTAGVARSSFYKYLKRTGLV